MEYQADQKIITEDLCLSIISCFNIAMAKDSLRGPRDLTYRARQKFGQWAIWIVAGICSYAVGLYHGYHQYLSEQVIERPEVVVPAGPSDNQKSTQSPKSQKAQH